MTHLGQRLSALIDGELEGTERERVLLHMARCDSCREEVAALRMLKRRMSALGDGSAGATASLTGRLIGLSALANLQERDRAAAPLPAAAGGDQDAARDAGSPEQRAGRYFLAGSLAVFLAGLGTAAFIAGGEPQPQAPTPPVTPSVDVMVFGHAPGGAGVDRPLTGPSSLRPRLRPNAAPRPAHSRT